MISGNASQETFVSSGPILSKIFTLWTFLQVASISRPCSKRSFRSLLRGKWKVNSFSCFRNLEMISRLLSHIPRNVVQGPVQGPVQGLVQCKGHFESWSVVKAPELLALVMFQASILAWSPRIFRGKSLMGWLHSILHLMKAHALSRFVCIYMLTNYPVSLIHSSPLHYHQSYAISSPILYNLLLARLLHLRNA